jgi:GNAT superfamily N-acetyltransferase
MVGQARFRLRAARTGDLATLVLHRRGMWEDMGIKGKVKHAQADRVYGEWARKRLRDKSLLAWIVENRAGNAVSSGCLWLQPRQPSPGNSQKFQPYLLSMYTVPEYRGKGLASKVVRAAVDWTRAHNYASLRLHASEKGRRVYRKQGFSRTWEMRLNMTKH